MFTSLHLTTSTPICSYSPVCFYERHYVSYIYLHIHILIDTFCTAVYKTVTDRVLYMYFITFQHCLLFLVELFPTLETLFPPIPQPPQVTFFLLKTSSHVLFFPIVLGYSLFHRYFSFYLAYVRDHSVMLRFLRTFLCFTHAYLQGWIVGLGFICCLMTKSLH